MFDQNNNKKSIEYFSFIANGNNKRILWILVLFAGLITSGVGIFLMSKNSKSKQVFTQKFY